MTLDGKVRILLCEDDENLGMLLREYLLAKGYDAVLCNDGEEGYREFLRSKYNLCVFDVMMPKKDGFTLAKEIRLTNTEVPIVFLTAKTLKEDVFEGFRIGADDYLTKPFEFPELVARLRALGRRSQPARTPVLEAHGVRLDPFRREVYRDGHFIHLSPKEFAVLQVLMEAEGGVLSAETLLEKAWDANAAPFTNSTRVTISHLRRKLGEPRVIQTVPGAGYRFSA